MGYLVLLDTLITIHQAVSFTTGSQIVSISCRGLVTFQNGRHTDCESDNWLLKYDYFDNFNLNLILFIRVQNINVRWNNIKIHLERLASQLIYYDTVSTSEGKKLKLERPIEPGRAVTAEAGPTPMDEDTLTSTRKIIKITKRTYKTASGVPIETSTTVSSSTETFPPGE
jgi:hypothetical protein